MSLTWASVARLLSVTQFCTVTSPSEALSAISVAWVPMEGASR